MPEPGDGDTTGGMSLGGEVTGTVRAGRFVLEVGSPAGTLAFLSPGEASDSTELRIALGQPDPPAGQRLDAAEEALEDLGSVAGHIERALELFTAVAQGKALDRKVLLKEVDVLIGALERLDRAGRHRDALRLARVLAGLLALIARWYALIETLRLALKAAQSLGDVPGIAWARHELGTLSLGAEDAAAANSQLTEALRLRRDLGDEAGVETTRHNLAALEQAFPDFEPAADGGPSPLLVTAIVAGVLLLAAGIGVGVAVAMDVWDDDVTTETAADTTPPEVEITESPQDPTEERTASFAFTANEDVRSFECRLDSRSFEECVSPRNLRGPLPPGPHVFAVRATDLAGNRSAAVSYEWTIEPGIGPSVTIRAGPEELTNETTARFSLDPGGAARLECKVGDESFVSCDTTPSYEVGEGDHTFVARGFDANDNSGPEATYRWTVDTTPPTVEIDDDVDEVSESSVLLSFSVSEPDSVVECVLIDETDDAPVEVQRIEACTSPVALAARQYRRYLAVLTATDPAGNTGEPAEETIDRAVD